MFQTLASQLVVETTGAFGDAAKSLCHQLHERRHAFASRKRRLRPSSTNRLMSRISVELQKSNAGMISIRRPPPLKLQVQKLAKIDLRIEKVSAKAKTQLLQQRLHPVSTAFRSRPRSHHPSPAATRPKAAARQVGAQYSLHNHFVRVQPAAQPTHDL